MAMVFKLLLYPVSDRDVAPGPAGEESTSCLTRDAIIRSSLLHSEMIVRMAEKTYDAVVLGFLT